MELQLREIRKAAGFKKATDFAEAIGIPVRQIRAWESGERNMSLEQAIKLAEFFGCTLDELAGRWEYVGSYSDDRQHQVNKYFTALDDTTRDIAVLAMRGMAEHCVGDDQPNE